MCTSDTTRRLSSRLLRLIKVVNVEYIKVTFLASKPDGCKNKRRPSPHWESATVEVGGGRQVGAGVAPSFLACVVGGFRG